MELVGGEYGGRGDGNGRSDYVSLSCRWSDSDAVTTTVHLKLAFCDDDAAAAGDGQRVVLRACAFVAGTSERTIAEDVDGLYEGRVAADQAAADSRCAPDGPTDRSIRVWLDDARAALVGRAADGPDAKYVYVLQRADAAGTGGELTFTWKIKLRPLGVATVGAVRLSRCTAAAAGPDRSCSPFGLVGDGFVGPLVRGLAAARTRYALLERTAAEEAERMREDNRLLLEKLRSLAEGGRRDDQRLMARFLVVLNAKKQQLARAKLELSELKQRDGVPAAVVGTAGGQQSTTVPRRRRQGRRKAEPEDVAKPTNKKRAFACDGRQRCAAGRANGENPRADDVTLERAAERVGRELEVMEIEDNGSGDVVASAAENRAPFDDGVFDADTQIDHQVDGTRGDGPRSPSARQRSPIKPIPMSSTLLMPCPIIETGQLDSETVFDSLWSGIL